MSSSLTRKSMLTSELEALGKETLKKKAENNMDKKRESGYDYVKEIKFHYAAAVEKPHILVISLLVFALLCGTGLAVIYLLGESIHAEIQDEALDLAIETGQWFSDQLDLAILPVFSIAQFVTELPIFHDLPGKIGPAFAPGSLPFKPPNNDEGVLTHRNVTGVCDDPALVDRFNNIAATIKKNAKMEGVLVSLQLIPQAVNCLLYPVINTEDFPPGIVMNNTGAIGHDLLTDPARAFIAEATVPSDSIVIAGPLTLRQCKDCDATVKKAFIARLAIAMPGQEIIVNGIAYEKWGFAVALINWNALIDRSGIYKTFEDLGLHFQLTRTDKNQDGTIKKVAILAESPEYATASFRTVLAPLDTTNNEWEMIVGYEYNHFPAWKVGAIAGVLLVSIMTTALIFTVLMQNQNYTKLKNKYVTDVAQPQKLRLRNFLQEEQHANTADTIDPQQLLQHNPIADLYHNTTIMSADISGFGAWASSREPSQVFTLLQTVFGAFDSVAKKRGVFNVEKGDCYVAVTGLPDEQPDHAIRMIKFCQQCLKKMKEVTSLLEVSLGPDTTDLDIRIGVHSGPVTAGVLVNQRSRLQLFGGSMDVAARLQASSKGGRVHVSQATASLLMNEGKKRWLEPRRAGETYWLKMSTSQKRHARIANKSGSDDCSGSVVSDASDMALSIGTCDSSVENGLWMTSDKTTRLVEWQVDSMAQLLKKIVAARGKKKVSSKATEMAVVSPSLIIKRGDTLMEEITEVISLPPFDKSLTTKLAKVDAVKLDPAVISQLRDFVSRLSTLYNNNKFHNWEHACHVTQSVHKLLSRIVVPDEVNYERKSAEAIASDLHDYTFGITSDPLSHFAVIFSALIHDVDHQGVPNGQLAKEDPLMAEMYRNQSIAEQHSVDVAWDLLTAPAYKDLRLCLFSSESDLLRFRAIVVNIVLATDIFDKELKGMRELRWENAFHEEEVSEEEEDQEVDKTASSTFSMSSSIFSMGPIQPVLDSKLFATNRKATIVLEHVMQASDVSHTMQHWEVYKKWNERLFQEMYVSWKLGRSGRDPSLGWYKGELWFFSNYVIPLASKLEECGVFGVAADECLFNATENRKQWTIKGQEVVKEMVLECKRLKLGDAPTILEESDESGSCSYIDLDPGSTSQFAAVEWC